MSATNKRAVIYYRHVSGFGCEVRSGDIVAMLFVDKSVEQVGSLRIIAERAFISKKIEQVSTLDKFINSLGDEMCKINSGTTKNDIRKDRRHSK